MKHIGTFGAFEVHRETDTLYIGPFALSLPRCKECGRTYRECFDYGCLPNIGKRETAHMV